MRLLPALVLALLVTVSARADDYPVREAFEQTHEFRPDGVLRLENVNGDVQIQTWDRPEIRVTGEKRARTEEELRAIQLRMDLAEDEAEIEVKLPKRKGGWFGGGSIRASVSFVITVPATARLDEISTVNSSVTVEGVQGAVQVETVNGGIRATNLAGDARLETVNGRITATFAEVRAGQRLRLETVNGPVTANLPADAGVALKAEVVNGGISCDFPLTLGSSRGRRELAGTIGDGRATLDIETVNGSIGVRRSGDTAD